MKCIRSQLEVHFFVTCMLIGHNIYSFADITFHEDIQVYEGEKVTLPCTSSTAIPNSVTWRRQSTSESTILWKIVGDQMSQVDTSGRLSLKKTASNDFHLVIHNVLKTDSATYICSVGADDEKQHVTVLDVRGIENAVVFTVWHVYFCNHIFIAECGFIYLFKINRRRPAMANNTELPTVYLSRPEPTRFDLPNPEKKYRPCPTCTTKVDC